MKPRTIRIATGITLLIFLLLTLSAVGLAPGYELGWWTMDSGGGTGNTVSTGGGFSLSGTLGQIDVDPAGSSGGGYGLVGGFWPGTTRRILYLPVVYGPSALPPVAQPPIYLPIVSGPSQDLVVTAFVAEPDGVQITISNQGSSTISEDFWGDLYINPQPAPTAVNQLWHDLGTQGGAWGVLQDLAPGDSLTLSVGDIYLYSLSEGTLLYTQVDSWNGDTTYGAVLEGHESAGGPTNNIAGPITLTEAAPLPLPSI